MNKIATISVLITSFLLSCGVSKLEVANNKEIDLYNLAGVDSLVDIGSSVGIFDRTIAHRYPTLYFILEDLQFDQEGNNIRDNAKKWLRNSRYTPGLESRYTFVVGTPDSIPLRTSGFNRIICRNTVHEFSNRGKMIEELYRILKPGGILTISETNPKYNNEIDPYCKKFYLTKTAILEGFQKFKLISDTIVPYPKGQMNIFHFTK